MTEFLERAERYHAEATRYEKYMWFYVFANVVGMDLMANVRPDSVRPLKRSKK